MPSSPVSVDRRTTVSHTEAEQSPAVIADGSVRSADGTRIGFRRIGSGPPIVMVHGSISTHADWIPVASLLSNCLTSYLMDRRGRGISETGNTPYCLEREYEDIEAVLRVAGPGASLLGHSFGAICCLGSALRHPVSRLVLYEPPLPIGGLVAGDFLVPYSKAVAAGDLDEALEIGLAHFVRLPEPVIASMRATPVWQQLRELTPTWIRELRAIDAIAPSVEQYRVLACPSMLLTGSLSAAHPLRDASQALAQVLPEVRVEVMEGQGHAAMRAVPELVAGLIEKFISA
jgi:pimeloyl-ACP methyl ester carboxylesterase